MQTNNIIPFLFDEDAVRVVMQDDTPWFVAADVCTILDINNPRQAITRLDNDEKGVISNDTLGGKQEMNIVNESGLYALIFTSRKPEAKRFKKWVTSEVLPSIRKTGSYSSKAALENSQKTNRLISLQQQSWRLMNTLKGENDAEVRAFLYGQLEAISQDMGLTPPPLENLGSEAPDVPPEVTQFWAVYDALVAMGVEVNHTNKTDMIAVNLNEIEEAARRYKMKLPDQGKLKKSLRLSCSPLFLELKNISSCTDHKYKKTVRCWVFEVNDSPVKDE